MDIRTAKELEVAFNIMRQGETYKKLERPLLLKPRYPIVILSLLLLLVSFFAIVGLMFFVADNLPKEYVGNVNKFLIGLFVLFSVVTIFRVIWLLAIRYELTNEDLLVSTGVLNRRKEITHLYRVKDFTMLHPLHYRIFGCGNVIIKSSDHSNPEQLIQCIYDVDGFCRILNLLVEAERTRKGVRQFD